MNLYEVSFDRNDNKWRDMNAILENRLESVFVNAPDVQYAIKILNSTWPNIKEVESVKLVLKDCGDILR